jgi:hypothetical protein
MKLLTLAATLSLASTLTLAAPYPQADAVASTTSTALADTSTGVPGAEPGSIDFPNNPDEPVSEDFVNDGGGEPVYFDDDEYGGELERRQDDGASSPGGSNGGGGDVSIKSGTPSSDFQPDSSSSFFPCLLLSR